MKDPVQLEKTGKFDDFGREKTRRARGLFSLQGMPKISEKFYFGKYNRRKISEIAVKDYGYLKWLINQPVAKNSNTLTETLKFYLNKYKALDK